MLATTLSTSLLGLDASPIRVEVQATRGVPSFELVGLAEAAVRESRVRVKSALAQLGVDISDYRIVVNLAPADVKKTGSGFDLAIAAATLAALRLVSSERLDGVIFLGELSLAGGVHSVRGVLPQLLGARPYGMTKAVVPRQNQGEAALVEGLDIRTVSTLAELYAWLQGKEELPRAEALPPMNEPPSADDLGDVRGQPTARRALEICAAGGHNLLPLWLQTRKSR